MCVCVCSIYGVCFVLRVRPLNHSIWLFSVLTQHILAHTHVYINLLMNKSLEIHHYHVCLVRRHSEVQRIAFHNIIAAV